MTFADLMSLLMCFFVLLLSFSEMDAQKYKQIAGSMKMAFGVQNEVNVKDIPKGTSVIAQEFSSGRPDPTPLNEVRQNTARTMEQSLDTRVRPPGTSEHKAESYAENSTDGGGKDALIQEQMEEMRSETRVTAQILREELAKEIGEGKIDIESGVNTVTIRIRERGSFPSGSSDLNGEFMPVMDTLREVLKDVKGSIAVEGHTDDIPISNAQFRSNWDLSAARALSVAHQLLLNGLVDPDRFMVIGFADTHPHVDEPNREARAQNRRVEIVIRRGLEDEQGELQSLEDGSFSGLDFSQAQGVDLGANPGTGG